MAIDGRAVHILRTRTGLKPSAFAAAIGVTESYLRDIESGRRLLKRSPELVRRIQEELDVPLRMIVFGDSVASVCEGQP